MAPCVTYWRYAWASRTELHTNAVPNAALRLLTRFAAGLCAAALMLPALMSTPAAYADPSQFEQRRLYLQARTALRQGQTSTFQRLARELDDYLLRPYLDYHRIRAQISSTPNAEVINFLQSHPELPATHLLHKRWLRELGKRRQWRTLLDNFIDTNDADLRCYQLRALYGTGSRNEALTQATNLWLQPVSQPNACDPLFETWRASSHFTEEVAWMRLSAAVNANQRQLARYLLRYFSGTNKVAADAYYNAHVAPSRMTRTSSFRTDTEKMRAVIEHGLTRLARIDAEKAETAWRQFARSHSFDEISQLRINTAVAVGLAKDNRFPPTDERSRLSQTAGIESLALAAVRAMNWPEATYWIDRLPEDLKVKSQWQYWLARSLLETADDIERADAILSALATQRHYYGFLAARLLGRSGQLNDESSRSGAVDLNLLGREPGIARSIELFAVGDDINGRREWFRALDRLPQRQQVLAAELAQRNGMVSLGISTANIAEASNHLALRFPVTHEPQFRQATMRTALPTPLLIAIARQESALESSARSSADARGLMQLLPSTARVVARRAGMNTPTSSDLYDPSTNIRLGSFHLAWLVQRYDGQAPLAIAAYNAGEHRVDRWIKDTDGTPTDVWIERIPFHETRNYVKNVLAFRHVYGYRLGTPTPMLNPGEQVVAEPAG